MKIQFSPSIYEHAAALIGMTPWEVSRESELLWKAHRKAYEIYKHSPIVVGIDIYNIEAEAYGCEVGHPGGFGIPAVHRGILESIEEGIFIEPYNPETDGRIMMVIETGRKLAKEFPDADVRIPISGPFSVGVSLRGLNRILEDLAFFPDKVLEFLMQIVKNQLNFCQAIAKAGLDVAFFESAASPPLISPKLFKEIELPALKEAMKRIQEIVNHPVPCIIGGNTEPILDYILDTGTGFIICPADTETDQEAFMKKFGNNEKVKVRINMNPNTVSRGSKEDIIKEIDRIFRLANDRPNILLGTGAVPYETPPENILFIKNYVS